MQNNINLHGSGKLMAAKFCNKNITANLILCFKKNKWSWIAEKVSTVLFAEKFLTSISLVPLTGIETLVMKNDNLLLCFWLCKLIFLYFSSMRSCQPFPACLLPQAWLLKSMKPLLKTANLVSLSLRNLSSRIRACWTSWSPSIA